MAKSRATHAAATVIKLSAKIDAIAQAIINKLLARYPLDRSLRAKSPAREAARKLINKVRAITHDNLSVVNRNESPKDTRDRQSDKTTDIESWKPNSRVATTDNITLTNKMTPFTLKDCERPKKMTKDPRNKIDIGVIGSICRGDYIIAHQ